MKFSLQLSADYPDKSYGSQQVYSDMLEQAQMADRLGYDAVSITEHHLINCLMMPAPLIFATKIASVKNGLSSVADVKDAVQSRKEMEAMGSRVEVDDESRLADEETKHAVGEEVPLETS